MKVRSPRADATVEQTYRQSRAGATSYESSPLIKILLGTNDQSRPKAILLRPGYFFHDRRSPICTLKALVKVLFPYSVVNYSSLPWMIAKDAGLFRKHEP